MIELSVAIAARELRKQFNDHLVLDDVEFSVKRGDIFALLGENGAGKTTTIKILTTLLKPDGGTAIVNGFDVVRHPDRVRESISLTGQFTAVDDVLTGRENLVMIARLRHVPDPATTTAELLDTFTLNDAADRSVGTYSGGMRRRLDLAMSLVGNPPILFLDEPTTGLDPQGRLDMWAKICELADNGTTILLTTQYLDEAEHLADRIAILHKGQIIAEGTLADLQKQFPAAHVETVVRGPSLEEIYLHLTSDSKEAEK